jgi:hypothetical protein
MTASTWTHRVRTPTRLPPPRPHCFCPRGVESGLKGARPCCFPSTSASHLPVIPVETPKARILRELLKAGERATCVVGVLVMACPDLLPLPFADTCFHPARSCDSLENAVACECPQGTGCVSTRVVFFSSARCAAACGVRDSSRAASAWCRKIRKWSILAMNTTAVADTRHECVRLGRDSGLVTTCNAEYPRHRHRRHREENATAAPTFRCAPHTSSAIDVGPQTTFVPQGWELSLGRTRHATSREPDGGCCWVLADSTPPPPPVGDAVP